ncbi:Mandelamide hydrolase [Pseudovibrio sp. Ad46]|uniref:amidase family protein n=1 Tax=Pseudovibrio sp. Ad46 TaxID=989432 RepID=UPI0007B1C550|nr:amidase family protein [Pseudovibrio sp. Ad46]KZK84464.1 Mandelamide hydrolase [Pseudovibrio sp. Ad46]
MGCEEFEAQLATTSFTSIFISDNKAQRHELSRAAIPRKITSSGHGQLDGAVVAIKANIALKGLATSAGSKLLSERPAGENATVIEAIINAGAMPVGHANMTELAFSGLGLNPHFGTAENALDTSLVPGGSSSGCASAIASGLCDLAIGSDTSGSTRIPAAFQGICGYRPTMGRYAMEGVVPLAPSLDVLGPMARNVEGIIALDCAMRGTLPERVNATPFTQKFILPVFSHPVLDEDISNAFEDTVNLLEHHGIDIERRPFPAFDKTLALFAEFGPLVGHEAYEQITQLVALEDKLIDPQIKKRLRDFTPVSADTLQHIMTTRAKLCQLVQETLSGNLMLMPTVACRPPNLAEVQESSATFQRKNADVLKLTMLTAFLNVPSLAIPMKPADPGLSYSVCGAYGTDDEVLQAGLHLEHLLN